MENRQPKLLITTPTLGFLEETLAGKYEAIRLWDVPEGAQLRNIRALTCLGHEKLAPILDRVPDLGVVACYTTGYDGIDVEYCRRRGIEVTHAPGATADAVAEHALALTFASLRNVVAGHELVLTDQWRPGKVLMGSSVKETHLGIVGLGDIGRKLAELAEAVGMAVSWWGPREKPDAAWPRTETLIELARLSDVLAVCARADASNRHLVSSQILAAMSSSAVVVNVARGQMVDEAALIQLLRERRIGGAALDVFETEPTPASKWRDVPNVVLTPHIGGATRQSVERMTAMLIENLDRFFRGAPLVTPVT